MMREKYLMNRGWRFFFGEPPYMQVQTSCTDQTYRWSRSTNARGPARRDFDDRDWEIVHLPHDFVALNGISETQPHGGEHLDFPLDRGSAWYRRYFTLNEADRDRRITLYFEGMGTFCEVYVNSMLLKTNRTNGIGFEVDITDVARFGSEQNVVAVHCDCHDFEAWYYEGGGITRNVWMIKTDKVSVPMWGTFVQSARVNPHDWRVNVQIEVRNDWMEDRSACVLSVMTDEKGNECARTQSDPLTVAPREVGIVSQDFILTDPHLWAPDTPNLYELTTYILVDGVVVDDERTTFGIREIVFDKDHGMLLNGKKTVIHGFSNHMLYLGVGEGMTQSMCEYQIRTLRDMGGNGYRTVHSPHPEAIMDWCDRYGLLVMDENRLFQSSDLAIDEVRRMIRRDRNHPSVCMWSLYNEEDIVTYETGKRIFRTLKKEALKLDPTRPVTGATSFGMFLQDANEDYDLFGFNHQTMNMDALHHLKPDKPIFCSEMILPLGWQRDFPNVQVRYGEDARQMQKEYAIGGFHFTSWAYDPGRPIMIGMEGTLTARYYAYRAYLNPEKPLAKICPDWDFPGQEGKQVCLYLVNNGDRAEIYVNGKLVQSVDTDPYTMTPCSVCFEPGEIRLIAYKNGEVWAQDTAVTPGAPAAIELVCENRVLSADGTDAAIVSAYVTDRNGVRCLHETGRLATFSWSDSAELITTLSLRDDLYQGKMGAQIRFFDGKCQGLFRVREGVSALSVKVEAQGLTGAQMTIPCQTPRHGQICECEPNYVNGWRISKLMPGEMDEAKVMREHQTERWLPVDTLGSPALLAGARARKGKPGLYPDDVPLNYAYYVKTRIPDLGEKGNKILALCFEGIDGNANIYITDGSITQTGSSAGNSPWFGHYRPELLVPCDCFRPGDVVEIWVMMQDVGTIHGIGWPVSWRYVTQEEIDTLNANTQKEWSHYRYGH